MMSRNSGYSLESVRKSIEQSIEDILTTRQGSRICRRDYGSLLFQLIDQPTNDALILQIYSAVYVAILRWEDRISLSRVQVQTLDAGKLVVDLEGEVSVNQQPFSLSIPLQMGAVA